MRFTRVLVVSLVAALAAACGGDDVGSLPDAPLFDALDAPPSGNPVTLTVKRSGAPVPDVKVYFLDANSAVVKNTVTDATGVASAEMAAGGSVTAIVPSDLAVGVARDELLTFAGVKPGDQLKIGSFTDPVDTTFEIVVPADSDPTATTYTLFSTCGSADLTPATPVRIGNLPPKLITLFDCQGTADMMVVTTDANGGMKHTGFQGAVTITAGSPTTLAYTYAAPVTAVINVSNAPATVQAANATMGFLMPRGPLFSDSRQITLNGGNGTTRFAHPDIVPGSQRFNLTRFSPAPGALSAQTTLSWIPATGTTATVGLDYALGELPPYTAAPAFDLTTHQLAWTEGTAALAPDLTAVDVQFTRPGRQWRWRIVAPRTGPSLTYPTVPTDVFDFNSAAADTTQISQVLNAKVDGGYDAVRADFYVLRSALQLVKPGAGSAAFVELGLQ